MAAKLLIFGMMVTIIFSAGVLAWAMYGVPAIFEYKETETKLEHERRMQGVEDEEDE